MADIAEAVGVTAPALYYHFANLDEIVEALLDYVVGESAVFATTMAELDGPPMERLHALVTQHVARLTAGPTTCGSWPAWSPPSRAGMLDRPPGQPVAAGGGRARGRGGRGGIRDIDPAVAVAAVSGLVYGALQHHRGRQVDPAADRRPGGAGALSSGPNEITQPSCHHH